MKHPIKAVILTCLLSASSFADTNEVLHCTRSTILAARRRRVEQQVVTAEKPPAVNRKEVRAWIASASRKYGVSPGLVKSIVAAESNFRSDAVSSRGCIGLMQLLPSTAHQYGEHARVPQQNIDAGTRYLCFLIKRYRHSASPLKDAIAAYNAGFGAVDRYHGVPPFRETQGYVNRVLALLQHYQS